MSSSSLRQYQRRSATSSSGHPPLARNHSVGTPTHHHSSSTSFATQGSYRSLPSPTTTTTTMATTTTTNILQGDNNNQLDEKTPSNVFNFDQQINHFHHSSINEKVNEIQIPRSTRHLCGTIIPLQSSTSSPNINRRSIDNEQFISSLVPSPTTFRKPDLKYRSHLSLSFPPFEIKRMNIFICFVLSSI